MAIHVGKAGQSEQMSFEPARGQLAVLDRRGKVAQMVAVEVLARVKGKAGAYK